MFRFAPLVCLAVLLLSACGEAPKDLALPATVPGGWTRQTVSPIAPETAPGKLPSLGIKQALRGTYDGPTSIEVEVYRLASTSAAFEARQTWRNDGQSMAYNRGDLFIRAQSPQPDRSALENFLKALEKSL